MRKSRGLNVQSCFMCGLEQYILGTCYLLFGGCAGDTLLEILFRRSQ